MSFLGLKRCISTSKMNILDHELTNILYLGTKCSLNTTLSSRPHKCNYHRGISRACSCNSPSFGGVFTPNVGIAEATRPRRCLYSVISLRTLHSISPQNYLRNIHNNSSMTVCRRNFSTDSNNDENRMRVKPVFVAVPNPIRAIRNFVYSWLIRGYFDRDFSMVEFSEGAKQAMSVVSQKISEGNFEDLVGLVSPKIISELKETYKTLGGKERGSLGVELEDILHVVPSNIAVHYDKTGGKFLNILMRFWCLSFKAAEGDPAVLGFKVGKPPPGMTDEQFKNMGKVFTCTFEFHRDVTTEDDPNWTITQVTLGKLLNTSSDGFPGEELE